MVVRLPFLTRPVALPVLAELCTKPGPSKPAIARELIDALAQHFPTRESMWSLTPPMAAVRLPRSARPRR